MKKILQITDNYPAVKSFIVDTLAWVKFDLAFFLARTINRLPLRNKTKWKMILKLRKAAK